MTLTATATCDVAVRRSSGRKGDVNEVIVTAELNSRLALCERDEVGHVAVAVADKVNVNDHDHDHVKVNVHEKAGGMGGRRGATSIGPCRSTRGHAAVRDIAA